MNADGAALRTPDHPTASVGLARDRMAFALFFAAALHAGLILGLGSPLPVPAARAPTIAITLVAPAPEPGTPAGDPTLPAPDVPAAPAYAADAVLEAPAPERTRPPAPPAQIRATVTPATPATTPPDERSANPSRFGNYEETVRQIAGIPREDTGGPRVRRVTSASPTTTETAYYFESWHRKVQRVGQLNYPEAARTARLYGSLRLLVAISADGALVDARVLESSGHRVLDEAAVRIVRLAAPFAPFPPGMRRNTDVLEIVRTWQFRKNRHGFLLQ